MKIAFLILGAVLILGGAGAGAYFYFVNPAQASVGQTDEHSAAGDNADATVTREPAKKGEFVEMDPLLLPVIDSDGITQNVTIIIVIDAPNTSVAAKVRDMKPRLQDAYIQDMYGLLNNRAFTKTGMLPVGMLKQRLSTVTNKIMGRDNKINDVLLQMVEQRPM